MIVGYDVAKLVNIPAASIHKYGIYGRYIELVIMKWLEECSIDGPVIVRF